MTNFDENVIIDLTDSFVLVDHRLHNNIIIELDDSTTDSPVQNPKIKNSKLTKKINNSRKRSGIGFGDCPICWDELGKNPLASTICGHVFCMTCLKRSLHQEKRCPTCRRTLRRSSEYHPLYIAPQSDS